MKPLDGEPPANAAQRSSLTPAIGFDDAFQYEDFARSWSARRIRATAKFGREIGLKAFEAWISKKDRHPY